MDDITLILSAVSKHTGIAMTDVVNSMTHMATNARGIACMIIRDEYPHLRKSFASLIDKTEDSIRKAAESTDRKIEKNPYWYAKVCEVRKSLNLPLIRRCRKKSSDNISDTMRLFGFDYTEQQESQMRAAMISSLEYMADMCAENKHPQNIGIMYSAKRKSKPRLWYKG